jgi:hypothetical protein
MAGPSRERIELGKKRVRNVLRKYTLANLRTLENKICDAGPTNQRIDPHVLTIAKKELTDAGELEMYSPAPGKNDIPWFYLAGTPELDLKNRYDELEPIHRATVDPSFTKRIGQTMEIAVSRALQERADLYSTGHYSDLNEHRDDKPYSKDEPPSIVGSLAIPGKKKLDFEIFTETAGVVGIEVKNIREWIYVNRIEVTDMLSKCCALNAVPVLIARRIAYETFSVLNACGVLIHQTYNQLYPKADEELASKVREKRLLGYHDVRVGNDPDARLKKFLQVNLPNLWDEAREKFEEHKELLCGFGNKAVSYKELVGKVRGRKGEKLEARKAFDIARAMESAVPPEEDEGEE